MARPRNPGLNPKELEVLGLVVLGKTNADIARLTGKAKPTVQDQLKLIYQKLGAENRAHAVAKFLRPELFKRKEET